MTRYRTRALLPILLFAAVAARAADQPAGQRPLPSWAPQPKPNVVEDRFRAEVTLLGASLDTNLRVDETVALQGTEINAEDDLGLDDFEMLPQVELTLLPGEHHLLRLSALSTRRSATKIIEREIFFDDEVYVPMERVDSTLNLTMFGLTYGYRFLVHPRSEITATFGIQVAEVEANAVVRSRVIRDAEGGVAPLPLVGVEGRFDFSRRWSAEVRAQYLTVDIDEVDGSIVDARAALTWRMNPYLVLGVGYRSFTIEVDSRDEGTPGFVDLGLGGPLLFVRASL
jgi:hypothetical protein